MEDGALLDLNRFAVPAPKLIDGVLGVRVDADHDAVLILLNPDHAGAKLMPRPLLHAGLHSLLNGGEVCKGPGHVHDVNPV